MNKRDQELDELLASLTKEEPSTLQVARWKKNLNQRRYGKERNYKLWFSLAAAMVFGFFMGFELSKLRKQETTTQNYSFASATKVERFINTESDDY